MMNRRKFLHAGSAVGLLAMTDVAALERRASRNTHITRYVRLGRTDLEVSDISFGSSSSSDPDLVRHALDRGVNYFDTAESYRWGRSEEAIGEGLKGVRDKVVLSTKSKAGASDDRGEMMEALEGSLRRLQTDYVDVYFMHSVNDVKRVQNPEWLEFTELAKRQGKIRFRGVSGHGSNLAQCLDYAIDHDVADVILAAYNISQDPDFYDKLRHSFHWAAIQPELPGLLEKAKRKNIGVLAMKTLMGARLNDMRPYERPGQTFSQAAFRWVLSDQKVDALLVSMTGADQIDEYVAASGGAAPSAYDMQLLERYAYLQAGNYCQPGCGRCAESCPRDVAIAEVLRTRMYQVNYGDALLARSEYISLEGGASACLDCVTQDCLGACPLGVPIAQFTRETAAKLG